MLSSSVLRKAAFRAVQCDDPEPCRCGEACTVDLRHYCRMFGSYVRVTHTGAEFG